MAAEILKDKQEKFLQALQDLSQEIDNINFEPAV